MNELDDIFEFMDMSTFDQLCVPLFSRIAKCISSNHFQVAERALWMWNNGAVISISIENVDHRPMIMPILFPSLRGNVPTHWNASVNQLSTHVLSLFEDAVSCSGVHAILLTFTIQI